MIEFFKGPGAFLLVFATVACALLYAGFIRVEEYAFADPCGLPSVDCDAGWTPEQQCSVACRSFRYAVEDHQCFCLVEPSLAYQVYPAVAAVEDF